jgi:hypothetical protein
MIYAIDTYFIHSSVSGEITGELPALWRWHKVKKSI